MFPDSTVSRETHVEISVEEPDLLGAGQGTQDGGFLRGDTAGEVARPGKVPLLLAPPGYGVTVGLVLQVDVNPGKTTSISTSVRNYKISQIDWSTPGQKESSIGTLMP